MAPPANQKHIAVTLETMAGQCGLSLKRLELLVGVVSDWQNCRAVIFWPFGVLRTVGLFFWGVMAPDVGSEIEHVQFLTLQQQHAAQ